MEGFLKERIYLIKKALGWFPQGFEFFEETFLFGGAACVLFLLLFLRGLMERFATKMFIPFHISRQISYEITEFVINFSSADDAFPWRQNRTQFAPGRP